MEEVNERIARAADEILGEAIENIASRLPDDDAKAQFLNEVESELRQSIRAAIDGGDYQTHLRRGAYETSVWLAEHYADAALDRLSKNLPRGKTRDTVSDALEQLTHRGIESFCRGASLDEIKRELADCAIDQFKSYATPELADFMYRGLKTSGKGSRALNRRIKNGSNIVAAEAVGNVGEWMSGRKTFDRALVDTAKGSAVAWTKGQGAELAVEAIKSLTKTAEREIKNKFLRDVSTKALTKLADANTITQAAGYLIDVGQSFRQLYNGEITKDEFLRVVGEKGTAFVLTSVATAIGTAAAGPMIGAAIGSMVGYFATNCLFGSVMRAFDEAEMSRKRCEMIREFCDQSIREMRTQRQEFERAAKEFLQHSQAVIDQSLNDFEASMKGDDVEGASAALNEIAKDFGRELQFKTLDEFDDFMSDDDAVFKL